MEFADTKLNIVKPADVLLCNKRVGEVDALDQILSENHIMQRFQKLKINIFKDPL